MNVSLEVGSREHEIVYLRLCLRAPSFNNGENVIVSQALITMARTPPEAEGRLCRFHRVGSLFRFFFRNRLPLLRWQREGYDVYWFVRDVK